MKRFSRKKTWRRNVLRQSGISSNTSTSSSHNTSAAAHWVGEKPVSHRVVDFIEYPFEVRFLHTHLRLCHDRQVGQHFQNRWNWCENYAVEIWHYKLYFAVESSVEMSQPWAKIDVLFWSCGMGQSFSYTVRRLYIMWLLHVSGEERSKWGFL